MHAQFYKPQISVRDNKKMPDYYRGGYGAGIGQVKTPEAVAKRLMLDTL